MTIVICPGYHPPQLTIDFLKAIGRVPAQVPDQPEIGRDIIYPADRQPPYSSLHLLFFIRDALQHQRQPESDSLKATEQGHPSLLFIGFSAGVVAAIGAAQAWRAGGQRVKAVIAIDGWGVPLWGDFPIHRMSHDAFTHWSSALLGGEEDGFYASPAVSHLDLWRSPQQVWGYRMHSAQTQAAGRISGPNRASRPERITAAAVLNQWLHCYGEGI